MPDRSNMRGTLLDRLVGAALRRHRERRGMGPAELSRRTGIACSTLYCIEDGDRSTKLSTLSKICEVLDVPLSHLILEAELHQRSAAPAASVLDAWKEGAGS